MRLALGERRGEDYCQIAQYTVGALLLQNGFLLIFIAISTLSFMKKWLLPLALLAASYTMAQKQTPDKLYGQLFTDVQLSGIFPDNKTFVDCTPKRDPKAIVKDYLALKNNPTVRYDLKMFVESNFDLPAAPPAFNYVQQEKDVTAHIRNLWPVLKREADKPIVGSSLLPLPNPYIVPGGRFREVYYWDSYFTMQGLQSSGETPIIRHMLDNFAYLIKTYGHIPNGNRTYYLSRSQPPFFSMMLDVLAQQEGNKVYATYQDALQKEYNYWTDKTAATHHVVNMPDGSKLTRYWDMDAIPRQESYKQDAETIQGMSEQKAAQRARDLRSGAESGWDFSSRWFADGKTIATIQTTNLVPVDLNGMMYHMELTLAKCYKLTGNAALAAQYEKAAAVRKAAINKYCYNATDGWYYDWNINQKKQSTIQTIAGFTPFFFGVAPTAAAGKAAAIVQQKFLKAGGVVTTLSNTGQQWDAPNGWAPLQWMTIRGLEDYKQTTLARTVAERWIALNTKVYLKTGKLMEKYNVENVDLEAGGGEYPGQDGFGWTNGVLLALIKKYGAAPAVNER